MQVVGRRGGRARPRRIEVDSIGRARSVGRATYWGVAMLAMLAAPGCATMRDRALSLDLRPCLDGFAMTEDGWRLGVRRIRPENPDPAKLPVVLCHGLGLNGTFWTITDHHLPSQLANAGYEVFVFDFRGSGQSAKVGGIGKVNALLRETFLLELGEDRWTVDEIVKYDVPAVLDYVKAATGKDRVNWVGHSLGGMLIFPYLELSPEPWRVANFVAMGSTITLTNAPRTPMLRANRSLQVLARAISPGRMGRPLMFIKFPGLEKVDRFYYTAANVEWTTVSRFYGYTLEDTGRAALRQLDPYLERGHFLSADGRMDYAERLDEVTVPILMVAGDGDILSDVPSTRLTFDALSSPDKTLRRFGLASGHVADYGHCDLVWSRYAPREVFPEIIEWLDRRQPRVSASPQKPAPSLQIAPGSSLEEKG